jgi:hypothetical protein
MFLLRKFDNTFNVPDNIVDKCNNIFLDVQPCQYGMNLKSFRDCL